ncbi:hypothetical protein [Nocardia cyriacigeorgica]|uniref:hypothetical protein n=1 Tax=Nocardia cyriacigeorgica TaxID=135487 RepID=UPI00249265C5|nr:hypothetical protein [Nocardia cyriacigeorgica]BDU04596.1 hypothetical protein FMUBM48_08590 [Nocardia cyriacigeorgica]
MLAPPSIDQVKDSLRRVRRGLGLARPTALLSIIDQPVQAYLCRNSDIEPGTAEQVEHLATILRAAIAQLAEGERLYAEVDFNVRPEHAFPTLTDRQESLAQHLKCAVKTVRRRSDQALETLAYLLVTLRSAPGDAGGQLPDGAVSQQSYARELDPEDPVRRFWGLRPGGGVDIVCSEIPLDERPEYASPQDRNYLRYAKFADLDTLIFVRTRLAQLAPATVVRDFAPSEYFDTQVEVLVVIGGPPWNAKYREFLPQLPFYFEANPLGEDDPLVVPELDNLYLAPRWTPRGELIEDLAVLTRLTVQGTTAFLLGGCLTLGVLGAARALLDPRRGPRNVEYLSDRVGQDDFVVVTEARRVGGITDIADLAVVDPLLLMSRPHGANWGVVIDNTKRFTCHARCSSGERS